MTTPTTPLYTTRAPTDCADDLKQRLLKLGCSEEYAETARADALGRAVQVASSYDANAIQSGRTE